MDFDNPTVQKMLNSIANDSSLATRVSRQHSQDLEEVQLQDFLYGNEENSTEHDSNYNNVYKNRKSNINITNNTTTDNSFLDSKPRVSDINSVNEYVKDKNNFYNNVHSKSRLNNY